MSYIRGEACGTKWDDAEGKEHSCGHRELISPGGPHYPHTCECECGAQRVREQMAGRPNKRPPLKLAKWKRGKRVMG